jgi:hypothetical protein
VLLNEQVDLAGFQTFTFAIPTAAPGDYLLLAQSSDQNGATDELQQAYAVPLPADTEQPAISLTYPTTYTVISTAATTTTLMVSGQVSDNSGAALAIINGQVVTPTADGSFTTPLVVRQGFNMISAAAIDASSNISFAPLYPST